jgi:hypothetical protein
MRTMGEQKRLRASRAPRLASDWREGRGSWRAAEITPTPCGRFIVHVFGARRQFERDLIRGRTRAGPSAAAAGGEKARVNRASPPMSCNGRRIHRQRAERSRGRRVVRDLQNCPTLHSTAYSCRNSSDSAPVWTCDVSETGLPYRIFTIKRTSE